jgi:hypothetical protein
VTVLARRQHLRPYQQRALDGLRAALALPKEDAPALMSAAVGEAIRIAREEGLRRAGVRLDPLKGEPPHHVAPSVTPGTPAPIVSGCDAIGPLYLTPAPQEPATCPECDGEGTWMEGGEKVGCAACNGTGRRTP